MRHPSYNKKYVFEDYISSGVVYHIAPLIKLRNILAEGIKIGGSSSNYSQFNSYFDRFKPQGIPNWVSREKAIYGCMNFVVGHNWHSHSAILSIKVQEENCWVGNENTANTLYEPFILGEMGLIKSAEEFLLSRGEECVYDYWKNSISFKDNLNLRLDKDSDYDAEVLIMHDISPGNIKIVKIISDKYILNMEEWDDMFKKSLLVDV